MKMALRAKEEEETKGRKDESGYGPEVDAVDAITHRLVPKDNARGILSTALECLGKLSLDSHYELACIPFHKTATFPTRFSRFSARMSISNMKNI